MGLQEISSHIVKLFLPAILLLSAYQAQAQDLASFRFENITTEDGLSQSTINDIIQDNRGFLWFATDDGLNRYDGYQFRVFKNNTRDPRSISSNIIVNIIEDFKGNIWVATNGGGLNRFNRDTERFDRFMHDPDDPNSISSNFITAMHQDLSGVILIGTQSGLNIFDPDTKRFLHYRANENSINENSLVHDHITSVSKDQRGQIWIGTQNGGLYRFDREEESFYQYRPGDGSGITDSWITNIFIDSDNNIWVGSQGSGLFRYHENTDSFSNYRNREGDNSSLSHNWVLSIYEDMLGDFWVGTLNGLNLMDQDSGTFSNISMQQPTYLSNYSISALYEDKSGVFWVGTQGGALNKLVRSTESFRVFTHEPGNPSSISNNNVWAILEDSDGDVWIGTHGGGLNRRSAETGEMKLYTHSSSDENTISDNFIQTLIEDSYGNIWVGTLNGLSIYDKETDQFRRMMHDPNNPRTISGNQITALMEDRNGIIWIGTLNDGLTGYNPRNGEIRRFRHVPGDRESLRHNNVWSLYEDSKGNFWLGTHGHGLSRYDRMNDRFINYEHDFNNPKSISNNFVNFIYESELGDLWVGTINGLNKFNHEEGTFKRYTMEDGLPNNVIYGIVEDSRNHLWLSTNNGIADFNPELETFRNYRTGDGLIGNEYRFGAYHRGDSGRMYFGGIDGAVVFEADSIRDNPYEPPVVLTNFQIFNRDVPIGQNSFLQKSITEKEAIQLSFRESVISFEYSGLHYASPKLNQYAFMLEGFDDGWQYVGDRRFTSYTNLAPGEYTFRVIASNKDGVWNDEGTSVKISISPPIWRTWWAYFSYAVMFSFGLIGFVQYRVSKEQQKKVVLQRQKEKLEKEVELRTQQLEEEKLKGENILRNILPEDIAMQLKDKGKAEPKRFEEVTVMFTDFKNFTDVASSMSAERLVNELNELFEEFDNILERNNVEKIKTIGDSYMAVGGLPQPTEDHALKVVRASEQIMNFIERRNSTASIKWEMRIGVHTGSVIAGVVGKNKFTYDVWGDTVIIANRMEIAGEEGKINISAITRDLIKDHYDCEYRGKVSTAGKGQLDMYFVKRSVKVSPENA